MKKRHETSEVFEFRMMEENIIEALKNDNIDIIGICGSVGTDKTRLARQIGDTMKREKLVKVVVMVMVGPNPDLYRIAHEISSYISVSVGRGPTGVAYRFFRGERVMIILDDVVEILDLRRIGIPLQEHNRSYKVMITSPSNDLCLAMGCHRIFTLQASTRGYSDPLKGKVGDSVDQDYAGASSFQGIGVVPQLHSQKIKSVPLLPPKRGKLKEQTFKDLLTSFLPSYATGSKLLIPTSGSNNNVHGTSSALKFLPRTMMQHLYIPRLMDLPSERGELIEDDEIEGSSGSRLALRNQDSGSDSSLNLLDDMSEKSFYSTTSQNMITEEEAADLSERNQLAPREEKWDGNSSLDDFCVEAQSDRNSLQGDFSVEVNSDGGWDEHTLLGDFSVEVDADGRLTEEINEATLEVPTDTILREKGYLEDFIVFCSVFPSAYEFTKDVIVWQWIAGEFMDLRDDEVMEEVCNRYFDTLLSMDYIEASGYDHFLDQMKYKVGDKMTTFLQNQLLEPKVQKYLDSKQVEVAKVEHLSLAFQQIDGMKIEILKQYNCLQTLIIHHCYDSRLMHLPSDFFLDFKALKILNFSYTNIVELPSSLKNLKELRFLDMSQTPICWLPETIRCCSSLQTLKLDGCLSLRGLPKCTSKLINLQHLVLDVVRQLQTMPVGIGKLYKLRTLSAFLVGEDDGCRIGELKHMNKLSGSFRIVNLENVMSKEEAEEACLFNKQGLKKIELQWSDLQDEENRDEEEILEYLRPHFAIQEVKILFYSGREFPSWISSPLFGELDRIILYRCRYCRSLPSLGELPSLKHLSIVENSEVTEIDSIFSKKQTNQHHVAFPKLEKLSFESMSKLERWTGLEKGDFPSLCHLIIEDCSKFVGLPFLLHLNSLLHLEISNCPELSCLPEDGLPSNLESLMIKACPKLSVRCCNERCEDWSKVAHVPGFYIDNQKVSPELVMEAQGTTSFGRA